MKRRLTVAGLSLLLGVAVAFAQKPMNEQSEKNVKITQGPNITNITGTSANMAWTTDRAGANHVQYRVAGSNSAWKSAFHQGGGTSHQLQLTGLEPGKAYEWQILTRDGDVRTQGQFQSASTATGTAPDVNGSAGPVTGGGGGGISGAKVPMYRAVNTQTNGGHSYSVNSGELSGPNMKLEGPAGYVMSSQAQGTQPLYRLVNANGDNWLTADAGEKASALGAGYRDGGIIGYIATSQVAGTEPFFRMATSNGGTHFYTSSAGERAQVLGQGGWSDQGVLGYVWSSQ